MIRKSISLLLFTIIFLLTACAPVVTSIPPTVTPLPTLIPQTATPEQSFYPQTYTDALDRQVTITKKPMRIISLAPSVTEILFAIGAGPQLVGRTEFCNYPPEVSSLPTIGGFSAKSISIESILALEPDLVIAGTRSQKDIAATLESEGIPVFILAPASLSDIETGIATIGEITGNQTGAQAVVNNMEARMAAVADKVNTIPAEKRLRVFYEVAEEPLITATQNTVIGELLTLSGAVNIFNDVDGTYPEISAEQILDLDPQAILGPSTHSDQLALDVVVARPGWDKIAAIKNNAIYIIDGDIVSRAGPRVVDALETISKLLYPEVFGN